MAHALSIEKHLRQCRKDYDKPMFNRRTVGTYGENLSLNFLINKGYKILERNYRTRYGEIDIIAQDKNEVVFVEVKLRHTSDFGMPSESVTTKKQNHIIKSALQYLKAKNLYNKNIRFDVVAIGPEQDKVEIIRSAFNADTKYTY